MCQKASQITFCTCELEGKVIHNKKSRRNAMNPQQEVKSYRWSLQKIAGLAEHSMDGLLMEPDYEFSIELTDERILAAMNSRNCFDFEYEPQEGDSLSISEKPSGKFMQFLFKDGSWKNGGHNPFIHQLENFNSGNVRFEK